MFFSYYANVVASIHITDLPEKVRNNQETQLVRSASQLHGWSGVLTNRQTGQER